MKKRNFKMRACQCCGELLGAYSYAPTLSPFFPDGRLTICNDCLDAEVKQYDGEWSFMDSLCAWADLPFIPEQFTKFYASVPDKAFSTYAKYFCKEEYDRIHWDTYQEKWKEAIKENNEAVLHPIFNQQEVDKLQKDWGAGYSTQDLYQLEAFFQGLKKEFGISSVVAEKDARLMAKISLEMDKCIAQGAQGIDKLVTSYNKIKDSAGFTSDNAQGANDFNSISELTYYLEQVGWKKKFHNDESKDIVDATIKNIQSFNRRLYQNDASIPDQIEARLEAKKRIDALEEEEFEESLDSYDNEAYTLRALEDEEIDLED